VSAEPRRFGLDLMRSLAIGLVLASHVVNGVDVLGVLGVELFFVLSGFLIGGILLRTLDEKQGFTFSDLRGFLRRRWYRTLPAYYLYFALFVVVQIWSPVDGRFSLGELPYYALFLQSFAWPRFLFFGISWSLCIEEWFYLTAASVLWVGASLFAGDRVRPRTLGLAAAVFFLLPLGARLVFAASFPELRDVVVFRLDAIAFGVLAAALRAYAPRWFGRRALFLGLSAVSLLGAFVLARWAVPLAKAALWTLLPLGFALLLPAFEAAPRISGWVGSAVTKISLWSYSMYLSHILVYSAPKPFLGYDGMSLPEKLVYKIGAIAAIVAVSALSYRFFEKPVMDLRDR
jgi:peptidoglycan/LPS O-acetylase OafA/YrhL